MTEHTPPAHAADREPAPLRGAVIAARTGADGYMGRYLHEATDPGATLRLLHELFRVRYPGARSRRRTMRELIGEHPGGWRQLGARTAKDPTVKPRRAPAPIGSCYCHTPDGAWTRAMNDAFRATYLRTERAVLEGRRTDPDFLMPTWPKPGDGGPLLITGGHEPRWVEYVYHLDSVGVSVRVRDGAYPYSQQFISAGRLDWDDRVDTARIEAVCAAARARVRADLDHENAATALAEVARSLTAEIPARDELVLHLLRHRSRSDQRTWTDLEAALARAAGLHAAELPGHLRGLERDEQIKLLRDAAHQLNPVANPAPAPAA